MDKVKRFFELKELWKKSPENERTEIDSQLTDLMESLDDAEQEALNAAISNDFSRMKEEAKDIRRTITIRRQLAPVLPFLSVSYLAKTYFGKSTSWFYQRLNGNLVNGKPAGFTPEELNTLSVALSELGDIMIDTSRSITRP